jgi:hypothetical protein
MVVGVFDRGIADQTDGVANEISQPRGRRQPGCVERSGSLLRTLKQSFFPGFAVVHVFAVLGPHNYGIVNAEK